MAPFTESSNGLKGILASKESTYRLRMTQPISKKTWTMGQNPSSPNALRSDSKETWTMEMLNASMEQDPSSPNASSPSRNARTMKAPFAPPSSITATPYEECGQCSSNHRRATSFGILAIVFCLIIIILIIIIICLNRQKDCDINKCFIVFMPVPPQHSDHP